MAFNGDTYRANKYRGEALRRLAEARDIKARAARGDAYDWEVARIATLVRLARIASRLSLSYRRSARL